MKSLIKILIGVLIIAGVCYGLNTFRATKISQPEPEIIRPVRSIKLQGEGESFKRKYFGTVQGGKRADLSFRVSGTLSKINVEKGASVSRGQLLATLDPRDFNTRISQAQSSLSQAQAQYKNAQADFKRYENLYKQKVIAKAQYDTYKTQVDVTRSAVNAANANVKSARDALRDTELRAPFDGIIADRTVENFQDVTAKQTIFSLQDLTALEIVFNIPDNDVLLAPVPQVKSLRDLQQHAELFSVNARFEAMPERIFPLTLKEIATQATAANTYPVTATMPTRDDVRILPGMAATVEIVYVGDGVTARASDKYSVPSTAILNEGEKNFVWRFSDGSVSKIPVTVGAIHNDASVEIESDSLSGGDVIITAGVYFLRDGQHVRLMED
ncbi:MAG: efflux RND transporter periplasmic adaptor subunit [Synergistaceae bacterium]|nr:efflux RND transporter periplasmic adaptor subunit [Synergistaceae bacterium]MBR0095533.1 efflux RND transporter periplasmic adaptor subunit [Synergistaceae bacterium]